MKLALDAVLLLDGRQGVEQLLQFTRQADASSALQALGKGIKANRLWAELRGAQLVGRVHPEPLLAVFGNFTSNERARLDDLAAQINEVIGQHRYIDYSTAEMYAARLAQALTKRFGIKELSRFQFTAIPRGGWIVLGMLSYLLDLRPDQIINPRSSTSLVEDVLVVVDDCALSGVRFQEFLGSVDFSHVIFCPLFAPSELCRAIERTEPKVDACINAEDLKDVAPARFGEAYLQWRTMRQELTNDQGYWVGIAEYIAFAWCEPQTKYWNDVTERFEAGWNILPPSLCLKRRIAAANMHVAAEAQDTLTLCYGGVGPLHAADRVLWTEAGSSIAVACMPQGTSQTTPCFRLEGTAMDMWRCILEGGTLESAEKSLLERYEIDQVTLRQDLGAFVAELCQNSVLCGNQCNEFQ